MLTTTKAQKPVLTCPSASSPSPHAHVQRDSIWISDEAHLACFLEITIPTGQPTQYATSKLQQAHLECYESEASSRTFEYMSYMYTKICTTSNLGLQIQRGPAMTKTDGIVQKRFCEAQIHAVQ